MPKSKVFLAWSGPRSMAVALALKKWLPKVIQNLDPWMSESDIYKGTRWLSEVSGQLQNVKSGIICLTPDNLQAPWINFEAGALSKLEGSYVCTYLHGLDTADVSGPLAQFQATKADREDTLKLLLSLNIGLGEEALEVSRLEESFNMWWENLDAALSHASATHVQESPKRQPDDMLKEIVDTLRFHSGNHAKILTAVELFLENQALSSAIIDRAKDKGSKHWRTLADMLQDSGAFSRSDPRLHGLFGLGAIKPPDSKPSKDNIRSLEDDPE